MRCLALSFLLAGCSTSSLHHQDKSSPASQPEICAPLSLESYQAWAESVTTLQARAAVFYLGLNIGEAAQQVSLTAQTLRKRLRGTPSSLFLSTEEREAARNDATTEHNRPMWRFYQRIFSRPLPDYITETAEFQSYMAWVQSAIDDPSIINSRIRGGLRTYNLFTLATSMGMSSPTPLIVLAGNSRNYSPTLERHLHYPRMYEIFELNRPPEDLRSNLPSVNSGYTLTDTQYAHWFWSVELQDEEKSGRCTEDGSVLLNTSLLGRLFGYSRNLEDSAHKKPRPSFITRFKALDRFRASTLYRLDPSCPRRAQSDPPGKPFNLDSVIRRDVMSLAMAAANARLTILQGKARFLENHPDLLDRIKSAEDWVVDVFLDDEFFTSLEADDARLPKALDTLDWLDRNHVVYQHCFSSFSWPEPIRQFRQFHLSEGQPR